MEYVVRWVGVVEKVCGDSLRYCHESKGNKLICRGVDLESFFGVGDELFFVLRGFDEGESFFRKVRGGFVFCAQVAEIMNNGLVLKAEKEGFLEGFFGYKELAVLVDDEVFDVTNLGSDDWVEITINKKVVGDV